MSYLARLLATTLYSGFSPIAPGTVGALVALVVLLFARPFSDSSLLVVALALLPVSIWAAHLAERTYGHDAGKINIDEVEGMLCAVLFLPQTTWVFVAAFLLFRVFDIVKPFPAGRSQRLPGGLGVVMDDVVAGLYANIVLQVFVRLV